MGLIWINIWKSNKYVDSSLKWRNLHMSLRNGKRQRNVTIALLILISIFLINFLSEENIMTNIKYKKRHLAFQVALTQYVSIDGIWSRDADSESGIHFWITPLDRPEISKYNIFSCDAIFSKFYWGPPMFFWCIR